MSPPALLPWCSALHTAALRQAIPNKFMIPPPPQANTENSRGIVQPLVRLLGDLPAATGAKNVVVPVTSDKGLCGGINTVVCK